MRLTIEITPKEIADLVLAIQGRRDGALTEPDNTGWISRLAVAIASVATRDTHAEVQSAYEGTC